MIPPKSCYPPTPCLYEEKLPKYLFDDKKWVMNNMHYHLIDISTSWYFINCISCWLEAYNDLDRISRLLTDLACVPRLAAFCLTGKLSLIFFSFPTFHDEKQFFSSASAKTLKIIKILTKTPDRVIHILCLWILLPLMNQALTILKYHLHLAHLHIVYPVDSIPKGTNRNEFFLYIMSHLCIWWHLVNPFNDLFENRSSGT